jgi:hypothetical protein
VLDAVKQQMTGSDGNAFDDDQHDADLITPEVRPQA